MTRLFLFLTLLTGAKICYGQTEVRVENSYPEGLYKTKEDFIKKVPSEKVELVPKSLFWNKREVIDTIPGQCIFYYKETDKKVKQMFAVSYRGKLYIQAASVLLNRNKKDKSQTTSFPASFVPVLFGVENYLYFELELANSWNLKRKSLIFLGAVRISMSLLQISIRKECRNVMGNSRIC